MDHFELFKIEFDRFMKFCERITVYHTDSLREGGQKNSTMTKRIRAFDSLAQRMLLKKNPEILISFKKFFYEICQNLVEYNDISDIKSISTGKFDIKFENGNCVINYSILYNKCLNIIEKINELIKEGKIDDDRQELNFTTALIYHFINTISTLKIKEGEEFESWMFKDEDSIGLINDVIRDCAKFLGIDSPDQLDNHDIGNIGDMVQNTLNGVMGEKSGLKGIFNDPDVNMDEVKNNVTKMMTSGIGADLVNGMFGFLQTGDMKRMMEPITGILQNPGFLGNFSSSASSSGLNFESKCENKDSGTKFTGNVSFEEKLPENNVHIEELSSDDCEKEQINEIGNLKIDEE